MQFINRICFLLFLFIISCDSNKDFLVLPPLFSDHMVLQQKTLVSFWGKSAPNDNIQIMGSWGETSNVKSDEQGNWELKLSTPKAGGPYEVKIDDSKTSIIYKDVLIGEVWLASGQSNMEMMMKAVGCEIKECIKNQKEEIKNANFQKIRIFSIYEDLTGERIKKESWKLVNPKNIERFSAVAYFFARKIHRELKIPVGIIASSWGGTRIQSWMSNKTLKQLKFIKEKLPIADKVKDVIAERLKFNDSITKINEDRFGFKVVKLPKPFHIWSGQQDVWNLFKDKWEDLNLNDKDFNKVDFDDSNWAIWSKAGPNKKFREGSFKNAFNSDEPLLTKGVFWIRTYFNIENMDDDYSLVIKKGISQVDQTYVNGNLIGNSYSFIDERNYKIPNQTLKKGKNLLAIRITDLTGDGGLNSPIILKSASGTKEISFEKLKITNQAFITNATYAVIHGLSHEELNSSYTKINDNFLNGYEINSTNGYSTMFENMIYPLIPFTIKGVIWYQGEANVWEPNHYQDLLISMINDWRGYWGYQFPFYYAQITPLEYPEGQYSQIIRDAQRKTLKKVKKTGMAVLLDIGEKDNGHPGNKKDVGKRLALLALDNDYNYNVVSSGPLYEDHTIVDDYIEISFKSVGSGLTSKGQLKNFEIAGRNKKFYKATARIIGNKVRVYSKKIKRPKHVRYAWKNWVEASLFNKEGLPASSFQSDY